MFEIINPDSLLGRRLKKDNHEYTIDNIRMGNNGDQIILRIAGQTNGCVVFSQELADAAGTYRVMDGSAEKLLCEWLDETVAKAKTYSKFLLGLDKPSQSMKQEELAWLHSSRSIFRLQRFNMLKDRTSKNLIAQMIKWLEHDQRLWKMERSIGYGYKDPKPLLFPRINGISHSSFYKELQKARAEAESLCLWSDNKIVRFEPFLRCASERYWQEVVRGADIIGFTGRTHYGSMRVKAEINKDERGIRTAQLSIETSSQDRRIIVEIFFSAFNGENFVIRLTVHCAKSGATVRNIIKPVMLRLKEYVNDMQCAIDDYFKDNTMVVSVFRGLTFSNLKELEEWLASLSEIERNKITQLWEAKQVGGPYILNNDDPGKVIAKWLRGIISSKG